MILLFAFYFLPSAFGQSQDIKCYPTNWWTGMKWNKVQIMVHGKNIGGSGRRFAFTNYPGIKVVNTESAENQNYLFVNIEISKLAKPGKAVFKINNVDLTIAEFNFELRPRRKGKGSSYAQGVTSRDFIYLIMPDRFSNGDPSNDKVAGMRDQSLNRDTVFNRHGGDLQGITNHLDYLQSLGVTTLWLNPVIENDMPNRT
ncbi:MAG: cyclomaltodextrinase N-terminal domain-containing protein, partial [Ginsengibacter sp.]